MSDFVQTMKDWKRMCNAMGAEDEYSACARCELRDFGCPAIYEKECDGADWNRVENVVTQWAAENPAPIYPTWAEYLVSINALYERWDDHVNDYDSAEYAVKAIRKPIPADIAEKLGLQPKEG